MLFLLYVYLRYAVFIVTLPWRRARSPVEQ